jgi:hypothetical protein
VPTCRNRPAGIATRSSGTSTLRGRFGGPVGESSWPRMRGLRTPRIAAEAGHRRDNQSSRPGPSAHVGVTRRPISVPASPAVTRPWLRGSMVKTIRRPSSIDRAARISSASSSRRSCLVVAGRLSPTSWARLDGLRGRTAMAAISRRRIGSASSSIPRPFLFGMAEWVNSKRADEAERPQSWSSVVTWRSPSTHPLVVRHSPVARRPMTTALLWLDTRLSAADSRLTPCTAPTSGIRTTGGNSRARALIVLLDWNGRRIDVLEEDFPAPSTIRASGGWRKRRGLAQTPGAGANAGSGCQRRGQAQRQRPRLGSGPVRRPANPGSVGRSRAAGSGSCPPRSRSVSRRGKIVRPGIR